MVLVCRMFFGGILTSCCGGRDWSGFGSTHAEVVAPAEEVIPIEVGMPVRVKVDAAKLERLRRSPAEVLRALDAPCRDIARLTLDYSLFLVPVGEGHLRDSAFLSGPLHNLSQRLSTTWTAGYAHPSAGPIHEGWHWGAQLFVTPRPTPS